MIQLDLGHGMGATRYPIQRHCPPRHPCAAAPGFELCDCPGDCLHWQNTDHSREVFSCTHHCDWSPEIHWEVFSHCDWRYSHVHFVFFGRYSHVHCESIDDPRKPRLRLSSKQLATAVRPRCSSSISCSDASPSQEMFPLPSHVATWAEAS